MVDIVLVLHISLLYLKCPPGNLAMYICIGLHTGVTGRNFRCINSIKYNFWTTNEENVNVSTFMA